MSAEPTASTTSRQPFSLRELFCLMTLAGVTLALVLSSGWSSQERWMLGLTLGGSLLGIALARALQWRAWPLGLLAGSIGGLITVVIIGRRWLEILNAQAAGGSFTPGEIAEFRNDYLLAGATTLGIGVLLALLCVACFLLLVWLTDASAHGMIASARRHPYRASALAIVLVALAWSYFNLDFLLAPQAWKPRYFIPLTRLERPMTTNHGMFTVRSGSLSHHGEWLLVEEYTAGIGREVSEKVMWRLDPQPQRVPFPELAKRASFIAFDCQSNRVAFVEWQGESYYDDPAKNHRLKIFDLDGGTSVRLNEQPRDDDIHSLHWLPGGELVIYYGDYTYGKQGHTMLKPRKGTNEWTRTDSPVPTNFSDRSSLVLEFRDKGMQIVDPAASRVVAEFPEEWVDHMMEYLGGDPSGYLELSPNGRFIHAGSKLYDREAQTVRNWYEDNESPLPFFRTFTSRGHAVLDDAPNVKRFRSWMFLTDVPLANNIIYWLMRQHISLIDPATGLEVARTRPLPDSPGTVCLSHDGSRLAVFTDEGVYVYDVPEKFR